jgi:hypothetical protein
LKYADRSTSTSSLLFPLSSFSLSLSVSQGPSSRLLSIFHSIKRMKRQGPIAEDLCVGAEAQSFNMLTSKPSAPFSQAAANRWSEV